ncbi:molybdopterin-dependent oxidoreductase [Nannocystis punicea]|uniref:Molybdopterin-dependent oxidoreductase n=1 Tax=Nannocystis punicea TaxID=2995304 RepID=A0ABY7HG17_9BACT|nr:molybdopterin-dependent oxidoreductase [Nannocystis poenicansa]WAS98242.1 molybdopterin-dependent oxidoreductase [Nannocystis poenicansa]
MSAPRPLPPAVHAAMSRRDFLARAASGTVVAAMGGGMVWVLSDRLTREAKAMTLGDGRPRLPPGQRVLEALRPMGGVPGSPSPADVKIKVYGEVEQPFELDWNGLLAAPQTELELDVHCVTGWSLLGAAWKGVRVSHLAERAGLKKTARHVVFEGAHGYTANVLLAEALAPDALVAHRHAGKPLARPHGSPVRAVVPGLYFWKSTKWLTGIKFVARDEPGYWETRGYHNHADPWKEERYA